MRRVAAAQGGVLAVAGALAALVIAAALMVSACGAAAPQTSASTAPPGAAASPAAVATPSPATPSPAASVAKASPSSSPPVSATPEPPLDRPTKKRPLRIYFAGDSLSGMPGVMLAQLTRKNGLARVKADYVESSRLTYDQPVDWPARVKQQLSAGHWDVGIFMIGANDSGMPMTVDGKSVMYPKKAWLEEYEGRARQIATIMLRAGVERVYWVGMPIMPSSTESRKMRDLNQVFEDVAASSPDIEYVDSYGLLSTKDGDLEASLRSGDGIHYTDDGAMIVAKAVWKAIRQDWGGGG